VEFEFELMVEWDKIDDVEGGWSRFDERMINET
jgi:hypothetical protein